MINPNSPDLDPKRRIELKLLSTLLIDLCEKFATDESFYFSQAYCSNDGVLRLSSPALEAAFPSVEFGKGAWGNGRLAFYEIYLDSDDIWKASLSVSLRDLGRDKKAMAAGIRQAIGHESIEPEPKSELKPKDDEAGVLRLREWDIGKTDDLTEIVIFIDNFMRSELLFFDHELADFLAGERPHIRPFPAGEKHVVDPSDLPEDIFVEGAQITILGDRFERNQLARAQCIAKFGAKCAICGFDFGQVYGDDFSGKIEVHHIEPLSEIREQHTVNPIKDLIPVCPNCHLILHSKPHGDTFTPDEVRKMIGRTESNLSS